MVRTRNQFHYSVRRVKKMSKSIRARKLLEASKSGTVNLLAEMKKIKGGKKVSGDLPECVGGVNGEEKVVEAFKDVYYNLYNSSSTSEQMVELQQLLQGDISETCSEHVDKITGPVVKKAACNLKPGKSDVTESFTSDAILNAPDNLFNLLALVFRSWLVHGTVTLSLLACAFLPLYKGGLKDPASLDSYRAIAGSSLVLKLFDNVVLLLWGDHLGSDSLQFGFKAGTSTTQCSWMVSEVASYFLRRGTPCIISLLDCSKAFDMCEFSTLFSKLRAKELPSIVIRTLVYVYEQQTAWVKWGGAKSACFGVSNGTRQGSVLSPTFFAIYIDELLQRLRKLGVGCHIGDRFLGAAGFADDIILLAPSRGAMELMLETCELFAAENNLKFSTDPNPVKSKTKCIYMCGKLGNVEYPAPLQLYGVDLPWVTSAVHLGHELHQTGTMEHDARVKRAMFIQKSTEIREMFSFANPVQVLQAVRVYAAHFHGSMLWNLYGNGANQVFRSWNTCVKLAWGVPRWTHNYFVEHILSTGIPHIRQQVLCQYLGFCKKLLNSGSEEIRLVANIVGNDVNSVMGTNLRKIEEEFGIDPWRASSGQLHQVYKFYPVPAGDEWRLPFLVKLLDQRSEMAVCEERIKTISELIESLCYS